MGGQWDESVDGGGRIAVWLQLLYCGDFLCPNPVEQFDLFHMQSSFESLKSKSSSV